MAKRARREATVPDESWLDVSIHGFWKWGNTALFDRGYIPNIFAFKNPYPLNPEKSGLFYFLLIRMKRPKSPKL